MDKTTKKGIRIDIEQEFRMNIYSKTTSDKSDF